nr:hypothetical protein [Streptomyces sp. ISL-1]
MGDTRAAILRGTPVPLRPLDSLIPRSGRGRRRAPDTFETKSDAEVWLSQAEADLTRGDWRDPDAGAVNFKKYAVKWVAERGISPTTDEQETAWESVGRELRRIVCRWLSSATPEHLSRPKERSGIIACMMQSEHVLRMADLRRACSVLLDEAERRFGDQVDLTEVPVDLYWNVDLAAAFDMSKVPAAQLDCGQVSDDVAEIVALVRRSPENVTALWHELDHLAGVMRLLAHLDLPR